MPVKAVFPAFPGGGHLQGESSLEERARGAGRAVIGVRAPTLPVPAAPSSLAAGGGTAGWVRAGRRRAEMEEPDAARLPSRLARLLSALFYGTCSFLIVLVNKALLTTYG